jgi:hypothetical protein
MKCKPRYERGSDAHEDLEYCISKGMEFFEAADICAQFHELTTAEVIEYWAWWVAT